MAEKDQSLLGQSATPEALIQTNQLFPGQVEILNLIALGYPLEEIATIMDISAGEVRGEMFGFRDYRRAQNPGAYRLLTGTNSERAAIVAAVHQDLLPLQELDEYPFAERLARLTQEDLDMLHFLETNPTLSNESIAGKQGRKTTVVGNHIRAISAKLGVPERHTAALVIYLLAKKRGILTERESETLLQQTRRAERPLDAIVFPNTPELNQRAITQILRGGVKGFGVLYYYNAQSDKSTPPEIEKATTFGILAAGDEGVLRVSDVGGLINSMFLSGVKVISRREHANTREILMRYVIIDRKHSALTQTEKQLLRKVVATQHITLPPDLLAQIQE